MNSAQIFKHKFRNKRTVRVSIMALIVAAWCCYTGFREGEIEVEAVEEKVVSNVPFAEHFMEFAPNIGWDWEMLAAVAYHESRYNPNVVSHGGARGLMQLMPVTGQRFGLNDSTFFVPRDNIEAGTKYIARLQSQFSYVTDTIEQTKFVLASYNAGPAHILDARRLARKFGKNPNRWADVEYYLSQLKYEEFYTDSVVQYGSFQGTETLNYVHKVLRTADKIRVEEARFREEAASADQLYFEYSSLD